MEPWQGQPVDTHFIKYFRFNFLHIICVDEYVFFGFFNGFTFYKNVPLHISVSDWTQQALESHVHTHSIQLKFECI